MDFYNKLYRVEGDFKEVMRLRDLALNGRRTEHNKDDFNRGLKLLTVSQKNAKEERKKHVFNKNAEFKLKRERETHAEEYAKFLAERSGKHGSRRGGNV